MISSPCKTCLKCNQSKEDCYKGCELLQAVQEQVQINNYQSISAGEDYYEDNTYTVHSTARSYSAAY